VTPPRSRGLGPPQDRTKYEWVPLRFQSTPEDWLGNCLADDSAETKNIDFSKIRRKAMSWDPLWEEIFRSRDWGRYPPEELIRFVARNFFLISARRSIKILELGCGPGANVWFLSREGFDTYAIDGSSTAIVKANERLSNEGLTAHLQVGDVIDVNSYFPETNFDAVIDVCCLECNRMKETIGIVESVRSLLTPGGKLFSMLVAEGSFGHQYGREVESGTFADFTDGPMRGQGLCHFFTLEEVLQLFRGFAEVQVEFSIRSLNQQQFWYKHWVVEASCSL
jgi:SAM-dependent methyltransferase